MQQTTSVLVMVPPVDFAFNTQTGADNGFQHQLSLSHQQVQQQAMAEFEQMVSTLNDAGLEILVFHQPQNPHKPMPDAVFPNNWFTTRDDGTLSLYPMATQNRQWEVQGQALSQFLQLKGYTTRAIEDIRTQAQEGEYLEGTGVMVFDHPRKRIYAARSKRCHGRLLAHYAKTYDYQLYDFDTQLSSGEPVYHTNVMMSVGEGVAVICDEVIPTQQRGAIVAALKQHHDVVHLSEAQLSQFCGNILQVRNRDGESLMLMSQSAYDGFTDAQKAILSQHSKLLPCAVPTIEQIGGGSVRCMLAEVFLPYNT
ncbi:arginine deiminase-related protein [Lacimicrobium sp. SS2-24]|uniref:arginine deiminase-related protein n=1 Tax=Lacimicrobium sp. SS2-24 TaxID=2005569 RepID=UPI000B4B1D54|nr:arginine deiminase-related protein [Lacimicrobium sp. SS2-24]